MNGSVTDSDEPSSSSEFSGGDHTLSNRIDETDDDDDNDENVSPARTIATTINNNNHSNNRNVQHNNTDGITRSSTRNSMSQQSATGAASTTTKRMSENTLQRRKRLVSTSLTKSPIVDTELIDYHKHNLHDGQDPYDLKYKLYAVVVSHKPFQSFHETNRKTKHILFVRFVFQSHSGMLNGGHYISYAWNPNNSWYCYNDSSCREIHHQPNIDPGSAYLLFYERQGLDYSPYLPNVNDRTMPNGNLLELDDADSDLRKNCVIS